MPRRANAAMNGNVIEQDGGDGAKTRPGNPRWRQGEGSRATSPNRLAMTTATKLPGSRLQAKTWGKLILGKNTYQHVKWIAIWKKINYRVRHTKCDGGSTLGLNVNATPCRGAVHSPSGDTFHVPPGDPGNRGEPAPDIRRSFFLDVRTYDKVPLINSA